MNKYHHGSNYNLYHRPLSNLKSIAYYKQSFPFRRENRQADVSK